MKTVNARGVVFGEGRPKIMTSLCGSDAAGMIEQGAVCEEASGGCA